MVCGILVGSAHRELVHVELADRDGLRGAQFRNDRCVVDRIVVFQKLASASRAQAFRDDVILNACRHAEQQAPFSARCELSIQSFRFFARSRFIQGKKSANLVVRIGNPFNGLLHQFGNG